MTATKKDGDLVLTTGSMIKLATVLSAVLGVLIMFAVAFHTNVVMPNMRVLIAEAIRDHESEGAHRGAVTEERLNQVLKSIERKLERIEEKVDNK